MTLRVYSGSQKSFPQRWGWQPLPAEARGDCAPYPSSYPEISFENWSTFRPLPYTSMM